MHNFSAGMKYQVGFSAFGGDSFVKCDGVLAWKVELDSFYYTGCVNFIVHGHGDNSTFCWTEVLNATITSMI